MSEETRALEPAWRRIANMMVILFAPGATGLSFGVLPPLMKLIATQLHDVTISQVIIVMPMLGLSIGGVTAGWITERLGVKRTILVAGLALALTGLAPLLAVSGPLLLADCFMIGFAASTMYVGTMVLMAALYDDDMRGKMIGYANAFGNSITVASIMLSGLIADHFGWKAAFLMFTAVGAIIVTVTWVSVRPIKAGLPSPGERPRLSALLPLTSVFAANFLLFVVAITIYTQMPLLLSEGGVTSATVLSTVVAMQSVFGIAAGLAYGWIGAKIGRYAVSALGLGLIAGGFILGAFSHAPLFYGVACALFGGGIGLFGPYLTDVLLRQALPEIRARAVGILATVGFLGGFANPFIMRPIREAAGLHGLLGVVGVATLVLGLGYLTLTYSKTAPSVTGHPLH